MDSCILLILERTFRVSILVTDVANFILGQKSTLFPKETQGNTGKIGRFKFCFFWGRVHLCHYRQHDCCKKTCIFSITS